MSSTVLLTITGFILTSLGSVLGWYVRSVDTRLQSMKKDIEHIKDITAHQEADIKVLKSQRSELKEDLEKIDKKLDRLLDKFITKP